MNIDKIVCINLAKRTDRWSVCQSEFLKYEIDPSEVVRIDAVECDNGAEGCAKSHVKAIQYAKDNNFENVLVLEDDFYVMQPFNLRESLKDINLGEFALFFLGATLMHYPEMVFKKVLRLTGRVSSAHSLIVNKSCYDFILTHRWPYNNLPPDVKIKVKAIDELYGKLMVRRFHCYHYNPYTTNQYAGMSDILGKHADFVQSDIDLWNKYTSKIRRVNPADMQKL